MLVQKSCKAIEVGSEYPTIHGSCCIKTWCFCWPDFQRSINSIIASYIANVMGGPEVISQVSQWILWGVPQFLT